MAQDPKIKKLPATKTKPERFQIRWHNGSKSFTSTRRHEVVAFKAQLMANGMVDPRDALVAPVSGRTFKQVAEEYVESRRAKVTPGTLDGYRSDLRLYVYPVLGGMDIGVIRPEHVRKVITRMRSKGLKESSIRKAHSAVLYPVFKWAILNEWRERVNPCEVTSAEVSKKVDEQPIVLQADAPTVLEAAYTVGTDFGDFCVLLYGTGLRPQEARVLTVGAIDWDRRVLTVKQVHRAKVGLATDRGKSAAAFRDIPLPESDDDPLVLMLRRRTTGKLPGAFLFVGQRDGKYLSEMVCQRDIAALREVLADTYEYTARLTFYAFRRGFATAMEDRSIPASSLKLLLGHARHSGATARYVRLTEQQVENLRPYVGGMTWRLSQLGRGEGGQQAA